MSMELTFKLQIVKILVKYNTKIEAGYREVGPFVVNIIASLPCMSYESCKCKSTLL